MSNHISLFKSKQSYIKKTLLQLWRSMMKMHARKVVHRNIKAENILYNPNTNEVKLINYDYSTNFRVSFFILKNLST